MYNNPIFLERAQLMTVNEEHLESDLADSLLYSTWQTEVVKDSLCLDYSPSLADSYVNKQNNLGSNKQIDTFMDLDEMELSIEHISVIGVSKYDFEQQLILSQGLKKEIESLMTTNQLLQIENQILQKKSAQQIDSVQFYHLQFQYDQLIDENLDLKSELQESQIKQVSTQGFYDRVQGQLKQIFKKQRELIDENQNLHEVIMKNQVELNDLKAKLKNIEKTNKLTTSNTKQIVTKSEKKESNKKTEETLDTHLRLDQHQSLNSPPRIQAFLTYQQSKQLGDQKSLSPSRHFHNQSASIRYDMGEESRQTSVYQTRSSIPSERLSKRSYEY